MPAKNLQGALTAVDWKKNINQFLTDDKAAEKVESANLRLAIWAYQLEMADAGNPALSFVRELQICGQHIAVLIALSLYKPAAGSIRSMFEVALYYSFFRTHPAELVTLVRGTGYFVGKRDVLEFHKTHTLDFVRLQSALGVLSRLEKWYGQLSSLVHGHLPGQWIEHKAIAEIKPIKATQDIAIDAFIEGVELVHRFFLCTVGKDLWHAFTPSAKRQLLAGLHGSIKKTLQLDAG
jgi:hypothetical protein